MSNVTTIYGKCEIEGCPHPGDSHVKREGDNERATSELFVCWRHRRDLSKDGYRVVRLLP